MAKLVFGMNQSLGGYVDHMAFAPARRSSGDRHQIDLRRIPVSVPRNSPENSSHKWRRQPVLPRTAVLKQENLPQRLAL
jgi:hypothetical protein